MRIEIVDDKLRTNFARWLEIARKKQQQVDERQTKLILILDGIDNFIDKETGAEESADWVPWTFPDDVKAIITCNRKSKAMGHFKMRKYPMLNVPFPDDKMIDIIMKDYR